MESCWTHSWNKGSTFCAPAWRIVKPTYSIQFYLSTRLVNNNLLKRDIIITRLSLAYIYIQFLTKVTYIKCQIISHSYIIYINISELIINSLTCAKLWKKKHEKNLLINFLIVARKFHAHIKALKSVMRHAWWRKMFIH